MGSTSDEDELTYASLLLEYLKEFSNDELKEFKWHLSQKVLKGFRPIPRGQAMGLDIIDVVDTMINAYCDEGALKVTLKILKKMKQNDLAQKLEKDAQKIEKITPFVSNLTPGGSSELKVRRDSGSDSGLGSSCDLSGSLRESEFYFHQGDQSGIRHFCTLCGGTQNDVASLSCGHIFCRTCISRSWDQSDAVGDYACPRCRKRPRVRPVLRQMVHGEQTTPLTVSLQQNNHLGQELQRSQSLEKALNKRLQMFKQTPSEDDVSDLPTVGNNEDINKAQLYQKVQIKMKCKLKQRYECIFEVIAKQGNTTFLNDIYTELYITEGGVGAVNSEHEVRLIEVSSSRKPRQETAIKCNDIFKPLPGQRKLIRGVLTKGIAGIGKTVSVQKFVLDWAEGKANQDVNFMFPLPFRELNRIKEKEFSLMQVIHHYFPEMKEIDNIEWEKIKSVFIFDGLDECRLPLNFKNNETWCDETESTKVDALLTNLISGNLLPSALVWITSRPAAAGQIPPECIQQLTEVRGFNDPQKEDYFMKRFPSGSLGSKIIAHIRASRTLFIMCHIPVFCWISAIVLERLIGNADGEKIPKTLTQMYTHFLLIQINIKKKKYESTQEINVKSLSDLDKEIILKLGELAFRELEKGNLIFYEEDLKECGIDVSEASVYSGMCTEIFKEESGLYQEKVYCFVHLSIQEFLAALYVFYLCTQKNVNAFGPDDSDVETDEQSKISIILHKEKLPSSELLATGADLDSDNIVQVEEDPVSTKRGILDSTEEEDEDEDMEGYIDEYGQLILDEDNISEDGFSSPLYDLHTTAIYKALHSENGHLDLFLRFLLGISLDSNQTLLKGLLTLAGDNSESIEYIIEYIKQMIQLEESAERSINLLHCLNELNDHSIVEEIQNSMTTGTLANRVLEPHQCSALAYVLLMSEEVLDEFDLKSYRTTDLGQHRLVPVAKSCKKAIFDSCNLTDNACGMLAAALQVSNSYLVELNLNYNKLLDIGVKALCPGLISPNCKLQKLLLAGCEIQEEGCVALSSALHQNPSHLKELDVSYNYIGDSGVGRLIGELKLSGCKLEKLQLGQCRLTEACCGDLASLLHSKDSKLIELELRDNDLNDSGIKLLCRGIEDSNCKLQKVGLSACRVTSESCVSLALALRSNPSCLRELDLSYNCLGDSGVRLLSAELDNCRSKLEKLLVENDGEQRMKPWLLKYACHLTLDPKTANKHLSLSEDKKQIIWSEEVQPYPDAPERFDHVEQVLCSETLSGRCYWEVEWTGQVDIGLAYATINRKTASDECDLGKNDKSWMLHGSVNLLSVYHNKESIGLRPPRKPFQKVGVYLDWEGSILSFLDATEPSIPIHTFHVKFTQPLHPGFRLYKNSTASLCVLE